jgi:acyl-CoA thioesterase
VDSQLEQDAPATDFARATAVTALGGGRFAGEVEDGWGAPPGPNGGYLAAILTRALEHDLVPTGDRQLRTLATHYLRPSQPGPLEIAIETIRAGKRFSTGRATAFQNGKEVMTALGAFSTHGLPAAGTWTPALPPVAAAPARDADRLPSGDYRLDSDAWLGTTDEMPSIVSRVKIAPRLGGTPFSGRELAPGEPADTGGWIMPPTPRRIDAAYLVLLSDVWWPPSLEPLTAPAIAPTIDLTVHVRADLPPDGLPDQPVLGRFLTTAAVNGTMEEDGQLFLSDGTLLAQSRQLALFAPIG